MQSAYVRLDDATIARLDAIAEEMTKAARGEKQKRSAAIRVVIQRGLEAIALDAKSKR